MDDKSSLAHSDNNAGTSLSSCDSDISPEQITKPFTQLEFRSEITQILLLDEEPLDDDGDVPNDDSEDGSDHLCNLPNTNIGKHFAIPIPDGPNICRRRAVCKNKTHDAPAVKGARSDLAQELKEKNPTLVSTHCVIHRQALASITLPQNLRQTLDSAINVVNYIKSSILNSRLFTLLCAYLDSDHRVLLFHAVIRWLCKGNMLARFHELKDELKIKIEAHLQALKHELDRYYRDSISELPLWHITRNPFVVDVLQLPEVVLEESL
ncbi:hypothetical protein ILUMI_15996 [Ignelater luminosus]|uniref:Uncharacterized protein n=1 Tax=Ignelater luminosus TaxID=2038154 RepID=A0A8K0CRV1_IGNLU|nr:hypothetical protein ILUMI_15996 [Ignelater luminosus]